MTREKENKIKELEQQVRVRVIVSGSIIVLH